MSSNTSILSPTKTENVDPVTIEDVGTGFEDSEDYQTEEDFYASNGNESYFWGED